MTRRALIAVVGDAGVSEGSIAYDAARQMGRLIVDAGYRVVTGGLGGVMEAACRGAHDSSAYREGDTLGFLPSAEPGHANRWVDIAIATDLGFARNLLVARSDAVVAVGGGAGTLSEVAFAWMHKRLVVALAIDGWSGQLAGRKLDHRARCANPDEDCIFEAATPALAIAIVRERLMHYVEVSGLRLGDR